MKKNKENIVNIVDDKLAIKIENLSKKYAKDLPYAIQDINIEISSGKIIGLIGHNGAGKSTTLKCLTGMLPYEEGEIKIFGIDMNKNPNKAKFFMGFVSDNHAVFQKMTGMEYITFVANIYNVSKENKIKKIEELEKVFQLGDSINNLISSYSHGMKQKVCMMAALIHEPKLWILDEPMIGLDPKISNAVLDYMKSYAEKGNTILFSSHNLAIVSKLCDEVLVIKNGRLAGNIDLKQQSDFDLDKFFMDENSTYDEFIKQENKDEETKSKKE